MRKHLFLSLFLAPLLLQAQTDGISYQAVIVSEEATEVPGVDLSGAYVSETELTVRFTIDNAFGGIDYQETQETATDRYGMINVIIGQGQPTADSPQAFDQIDWDGTPKDLIVEVALGGGDFGLFSDQPLLFVPYAHHRNITATGSLTVDGPTTLNGSLDVTNASPVSLSGTLNVDGATTLNDQLTVNGPARMNGTLSVEEAFTAESTSQLNGQVTINAGTTGGESSYSSYALRVQGTDQGMAVKLNGSATEARNFVTFMDVFGTAKGRIEGQTLSELHSSFRFIWDYAMAGLSEAFIVAEGVACGFQLDAAEAGVMTANAVLMGAQWVELAYDREVNVGVSYQSGGADYAEWLERADPGESFSPGDVVGVHGGRISRRTEGAQHVLAISSRPIVLGNMPEEGLEHLYEQVGFLGQVLVKVAGPVRVGDVVVPSGRNDGIATAWRVDELPSDRLGQVIGVAWEDRPDNLMGLVNVAIGMDQRPVAHRLTDMERELESLRRDLDMLLGRSVDSADGPPASLPGMEQAPVNGPVPLDLPRVELSDAEFETWLLESAPVFEAVMDEVRKRFTAWGSDYQRFEDVRVLVDEPREALRGMHRGDFLPTVWQAMRARAADR
ncbi:MAG: hypothetical protein KDB96_11790 [Flavobacteriales bacterium]|nr:hypothetical protein [Flavobacteriales bacterium]